MPRSSRHKSHKQSKHREQSDSDEDVKTKDTNGRDDFPVRISGSSEKRKVSSGKDATGHGNGDATEEYSGSKRKREKTASGVATDRWNGGEVEGENSITMEKEIKGVNSRVDADKSSRSKSSSDLRSKSSRKHETSNEKREEVVVNVREKEESRTGNKVDLKRNSEKDQGRKEARQHKEGKESKDRDRGSERKVDSKRDVDTRGVVNEVSMKMDLNEERQAKHWAVQDEFRNLELEKELEKRIKRRTDSSREKHQADVKESESRKHSSKTDSAKNGRNKEEKHKDGSYGDKHLEDGDRESRYREEKLLEDPERDRRNKDVKHREDGEREQRYKDSKYHDDVDRDSRHKNDKHRDGGHRDSRYEENNIREDSDRVKRKREDKFLEDDNVDNNRYNDKHHETSNGESKDKVDKIRDGREREDRRRDDKYREDGSKDGRQKEEKHREDTDKDNRHKDGKQRDDSDRAKRLRDIKYRDEHLRDGSIDKHDAKRVRIESAAFERHKKSTNQDVHDHNSRDKDEKERRRGTDKDNNDSRSFNAKDQTSEVDKKYVGSARIDTVSDQGKSSSRNADVEISPSRSRRRNSPNSGAAAKSHSRIMQEDVHEEKSRNRLSSKKEFGGAGGGGGVENASSISRSIHKDDLHYRELSVEKRPKLDARSSPLQLVDKSPSSANVERRHFSKSDVRRSYDIDDSGQRSGGGSKDYPGKEGGRGSRDLAMETFPGNDDTFSASSPFTRSNQISGDSRSLLPSPLFRTGSDSHSIIGSMEDDSRGGKSNNHRSRRVGDSNMGRSQGNAWKGIQNWPSPVANGFMPFQHGPTSVGYHPMMQQFHAPQIFGVRPPMELNHPSVPYHLPDSDRFSVHGRPPLGWHNPMDDSTSLMWDGNNAAVYRDESQIFGRLGWDQNRAIGGMQSWETRQDSWKGHQSGSNAEMPSLPHRGDGIINGLSDDVSIAQSSVQSESDLNLQNVKADTGDVSQLNAVVENEIVMAPKTISEEIQNQSEVLKKVDASRRIIYLSKIGVSVDITAPDFYDSCMNFKDIEDEPNSGKDDSVILFLEGAMQNRKGKYGNTSKSLPQPTTNGAIFQKALSLYHKQTEEWRTFTYKEKEKVLQSNDNVKDLSDMAGHEEDKPLPIPDGGIVESSPSILHQMVLPDDVMLDAEEVVTDLDKASVPMDIDKVLPLQKFMEDNDDDVMINKEDEVVENGEDASNPNEDTKPADDDPNEFAEEQSSSPPNEEKKRGGGGNDDEEEGGGSLILSDIVPPLSEDDDVVMPDSDNLTRIHQCSSESIH